VRFLVFFSCFAGKNAFLDGFLDVFTVVQPLVWLLDRGWAYGSTLTPLPPQRYPQILESLLKS